MEDTKTLLHEDNTEETITLNEDETKTFIMDFESNQDSEDITQEFNVNLDEFDEEHTKIDDDFTYTNINIKEIIPTQEKTSPGLIIQNPLKELIKKHNLIDKKTLESMNDNKSLNIENLLNSYSIDSNKLYKLLANELNMKSFDNENDIIPLIDDSTIDIGIQKNLDILIINVEINDSKKEYFLISNPFDYELRDYLKTLLNKRINFALCKKQTIKKSIAKYISEGDVKFKFSLSSEDQLEILNRDEVEDIGYTQKEDIPIIPLVNYIILNAYENRTSDIHIEPTDDDLIVRYRIDGVLSKEITLPILIHKEVISRIKILSEMNVAEKRLPQDGRFSLRDKNNKDLDIRVSTFPTVYGEKIVMRLLEQDALKPSLEDLHLTYDQLKVFENKINSPYGLILISGPTGSGKTTTLYSALSTVDKEKLNVLTVENPVEYRLDGVHQMQVNSKIGLTFASGLKTILRQDPDVIMLGEVRDLETANMAIRASLTGHIVLSTIHTNDAVGVVIRLVNMGIDPFLVASSVSLTISQRLVRKICPHCADVQTIEQLEDSLIKKGISKEKINSLGLNLEEIPDFVYGKGCSNCRGTGYLGRQAVFEFFELTDEIIQEVLKPIIDENKIRELNNKNGYKSITENTWDLVIEGVTTVEEIIRVIGE